MLANSLIVITAQQNCNYVAQEWLERMKTIAIEDKKIIEKIKDEYRRRGWIRDLLLFILSINTGAKLIYLLNLKVGDVKGKNFLKIKDSVKIARIYTLNSEVKSLLEGYCKSLSKSEFLFSSLRNSAKPIDRIEVFRKFKTICEDLGLNDRYSVASWRKTFGYHYYKKFKDLALLQWIYGQNTPQETLNFIGVKVNFNDKLNKEFCL